MYTRKSFTIVSFATITLLILVITSKRLGAWSSLNEYYYRPDGRKSYYAPQVPISVGNDTDSADSADTQTPSCNGYPQADNILVIMKTGASESFSRVPTQLVTVLKCIPNFLIFSDMEQEIGGYKIHDSLATVLDEAKEGNSDFDLYRRQQACIVDQENCNNLGDPSSEGWNLDKYKNIHIAEKAYQMRPDFDWYVFIDADTYVLWPNLVEWLGKLKPTRKLYMGSVSLISDFSFGHGGSGYVLSQAAMKASVGKHKGLANEYDVQAKKECCGDYLFALALQSSAKLQVEQVWPTINGEKPTTLPFGPSHWCQPIVTMHHLSSEEINTFWKFETKRYNNTTASPSPIIMRDIFGEYLEPHLARKRKDWDNRSDDRFYLDMGEDGNREWEDWMKDRMKNPEEYSDVEKLAHTSAQNCAIACRAASEDDCFQWAYKDGSCGFGRSFALGKPVKPSGDDEKDHMVSGWDMPKIRSWIAKQEECGKVEWPRP